jgi:hypothetical protein
MRKALLVIRSVEGKRVLVFQEGGGGECKLMQGTNTMVDLRTKPTDACHSNSTVLLLLLLQTT